MSRKITVVELWMLIGMNYATKLTTQSNYRIGQSAYNVLLEHRPDLAREIGGHPTLDPFHTDANLDEFSLWIAENWIDHDEEMRREYDRIVLKSLFRTMNEEVDG